MNSRRNIAAGTIAGIVVIVFALCSCCLCGTVGLLTVVPQIDAPSRRRPAFDPGNRDADPVAEATIPVPTTAPPPDEAEETVLALKTAVIPDADLHELGIRFLGVPPETPRIARTESPDYPVGTTRLFKAANLDENENFEIEAVLAYKTEHVYMWVEQGLNVDQNDVEAAAELFESHTYPTNRAFFGTEWSPGVDGDPHLSILHARNLGRTVAGYFSSADSYVREVRDDSNEMEMFYIHIDRKSDLGDAFYNGVLAHEFQHMIHWYNDRNETTWLNEGCSELAMALNDRRYPGGAGMYDVGGSEYAYLDNPDTQLNTWPEVGETGSASPHYGAAYLFMSYFLDRFGESATQSLVAHDENGMESVDAVLAELGLDLTHRDVFADWVVANWLDDPSVGSGEYGYEDLDIYEPISAARYTENTGFPMQERSTVSQYGVDYIEVESTTPLQLTFTGSTQAQLLATEAYGGQYLWWSNRADESNPRLTRRLDLSTADSAELSFRSWYHIEEDWDYAYVVVGTTASGRLPSDLNDHAIAWEILDDGSLQCTTRDPNNGNLGCGITGRSEGWEFLTADLTPFVGQEVAIRFEYVTDAAVNQAGLALDDIRLTVDGDVVLQDDAETDDEAWVVEGFVRHANVLPQTWLVQLIQPTGSGVSVERLLPMDGATSGSWTLPFSRENREATLAISALAPVTTEAAVYELSLSESP